MRKNPFLLRTRWNNGLLPRVSPNNATPCNYNRLRDSSVLLSWTQWNCLTWWFVERSLLSCIFCKIIEIFQFEIILEQIISCCLIFIGWQNVFITYNHKKLVWFILLYFQTKNLQFVRNEYHLKVKFYFLFPIKDLTNHFVYT